MFYSIIVFILLTAAGFLLCRQILKIPKMNMKKNIKNLQTEREKPGKQLLNRFVMPLVKPLARFIPLDTIKEARMASILRRGGMELSPREYYARAILCALFILPLALVLFVMGMANLALIVLIFSVVVYFHFTTDLKDKEKKKRIETELPGFVRSILYRLDDSKDRNKIIVQVDLVQVFEDYLKVASEAFHDDVAILVMEMKSMNIETALRNLNERLGLTDVSYLVSALIGLHRGEHQGEALAYLSRDMDTKAKEVFRRKLNILPRRVKIASIPLVAVTLACLLYVIGSHMVKSMGGLF